MICLFARHRLGAYLDGALEGRASQALAHHLEGCPSCRQEVDGLRRLKVLLHQALPAVAEPDWSGFWPGIVRGIQDGSRRTGIRVRPRWGRRWVASGVATAVIVLVVAIAYENWPTTGLPEERVVVTAANTQYPGGTMVYNAPEKLAVVWVFDE